MGPKAPEDYANSLSAFKAVALTDLRAGLAAILISSPVNGLRPIRALVAFLTTRRILMPNSGMVTSPEPLGFT